MAASLFRLPDAADVEAMSAEEILALVTAEFSHGVALACSFQKEETVLLDMLFAIEPKARVFAIDTHYLFPETYQLWHAVERRYGTTIEVFGVASREVVAVSGGEDLWERKPDLYLAVAKVEPL